MIRRQERVFTSRRMGGSLRGGNLRGGRAVSTWAVAALILTTASSKAASVAAEVFCTPLTLRTYWRAAASISSGVAGGSKPLRMVMLRHMPEDSTSPTASTPPGRRWRSAPTPLGIPLPTRRRHAGRNYRMRAGLIRDRASVIGWMLLPRVSARPGRPRTETWV